LQFAEYSKEDIPLKVLYQFSPFSTISKKSGGVLKVINLLIRIYEKIA
jgi:hypothetical protein